MFTKPQFPIEFPKSKRSLLLPVLLSVFCLFGCGKNTPTETQSDIFLRPENAEESDQKSKSTSQESPKNLADNLSIEQIKQMNEVLGQRNIVIARMYTIPDPNPDYQKGPSSGGSGFILEIKNGVATILTNWHVVDQTLGLPGRDSNDDNTVISWVVIGGKLIEIKSGDITRIEDQNGNEIDLVAIKVKVGSDVKDMEKMPIGKVEIDKTVAMTGSDAYKNYSPILWTERNKAENKNMVISRTVQDQKGQVQTDGYDFSLDFASPTKAIKFNDSFKNTSAEEIINPGSSGGGIISYQNGKLVAIGIIGREGQSTLFPNGQGIGIKDLNLQGSTVKSQK